MQGNRYAKCTITSCFQDFSLKQFDHLIICYCTILGKNTHLVWHYSTISSKNATHRISYVNATGICLLNKLKSTINMETGDTSGLYIGRPRPINIIPYTQVGVTVQIRKKTHFYAITFSSTISWMKIWLRVCGLSLCSVWYHLRLIWLFKIELSVTQNQHFTVFRFLRVKNVQNVRVLHGHGLKEDSTNFGGQICPLISWIHLPTNFVDTSFLYEYSYWGRDVLTCVNLA